MDFWELGITEMDQESRWISKYNEVVEFINTNHRNPSRHRIEEHDMLNWCKANRKRMNAGDKQPTDLQKKESHPLAATKERLSILEHVEKVTCCDVLWDQLSLSQQL